MYAVFAFGFSAAGLIPVTTVVTRWYHTRRSVALSVASTGLSVGGIVLTPVAKWLIDNNGLEASTPILAVVWVVCRRGRSERTPDGRLPSVIGNVPTELLVCLLDDHGDVVVGLDNDRLAGGPGDASKIERFDIRSTEQSDSPSATNRVDTGTDCDERVVAGSGAVELGRADADTAALERRVAPARDDA